MLIRCRLCRCDQRIDTTTPTLLDTIRMSLAHALLAAGLLSVATAGESPSPPATTPIGRTVDEFQLPDVRGRLHSLSDFDDQALVVLVFLGTECPLARLYSPRLNELVAEFEPRGVAFLGINSNVQDSNRELAQFAAEHELAFPLLKDLRNELADRVGAQRTPEAFVLDHERVIRYWGRIDDKYGFKDRFGYQRATEPRRDLAEAINDLLAGKKVRQPVTEPAGCFIGRIRQPDKKSPVTWSGRIAVIFQTRCQPCHRPGEIAPFPLVTFEDVAGWEETVAEVVANRRMPPWHANPKHGSFRNDLRLSDEEISLIAQWVDHGAPAGDEVLELPENDFPDGWWRSEPDLVLQMADEPYAVPAEGTVEYQYFTVDPGFTEDRWVWQAESRPGNPAVVHHINVFVWTREMGPNFSRDDLTDQLLSGYAPGIRPVSYPQGTAARIPAGAKLVFQMHYTPNGSATTDLSFLGLSFVDSAAVKHQVSTRLAIDTTFVIPPGASRHLVESKFEFGEDALVYALTPHMHLRGKSFRFEAFYVDGEREVLLDVPHYDFNWQTSYILTEPKLMPRGTIIGCTAVFDNSDANPANPDPSAAVRWGDQTTHEMMIGYIQAAPASSSLHPVRKAPAIPPIVSRLRAQESKLVTVVVTAVVVLVFGGGVTWMLVRKFRSVHKSPAHQ